MVTFLEPAKFAVILNEPSMAQYTAKCHERIDDRAHLTSHTTSVRFLDVPAIMSLFTSVAEIGAPDTSPIVSVAEGNLDEAHQSCSTAVEQLTPAA